jgi:hypothetical protein
MANAKFKVKKNGTLEIKQVGPPVEIDTDKNITITPLTGGDLVLEANSDGSYLFNASTPVSPDPPDKGSGGKVAVAVNTIQTQVTITVTPPAKGASKLTYSFQFVAVDGTKIDPVIVCDPIPIGSDGEENHGHGHGHGRRPKGEG